MGFHQIEMSRAVGLFGEVLAADLQDRSIQALAVIPDVRILLMAHAAFGMDFWF